MNCCSPLSQYCNDDSLISVSAELKTSLDMWTDLIVLLMYYSSWSHVQARWGSKGSHKFCAREIICFTTATNPIFLSCVYLGARLPSHSSFRYTEGWHGLYDLLQTIVSENMTMIFSYLIVPSFTYPSCLQCPLKQCLLPLSQFHNTHHLLSKSTRSV